MGERRRVASGGRGLTHANALQKLKTDIEEVLAELKDALSGRAVVDVPFDAVFDHEDGDDHDENHRISIPKKSPLRISAAIPFDYWSLTLFIFMLISFFMSSASSVHITIP